MISVINLSFLGAANTTTNKASSGKQGKIYTDDPRSAPKREF